MVALNSLASKTFSFHFSPKFITNAKIVWRNVIIMSLLHVGAAYGWYLCIMGEAKLITLVYYWFVAVFSSFGILAGAHRLWSHKSYKAKIPLRILLAIMQTMALQNDIYEWCRDHRVHHKYSETDADPHNSKRGFFFAHMGWLLCKKHPEVISKGKQIDMQDLWSDPIIRFQRRFYMPLVLIFWGILPTFAATYILKETLMNAILLNIYRYVVSLHQTWLVNSSAHIYGSRPYDVNINPRENKNVAYLSFGEGYHNYHHTFPWDYSASEFGWKDNFNPATAFIELFAKIGWAYDLKAPSQNVILRRIDRCGDKTIQNRISFSYWIDILIGNITVAWPIWTTAALRLLFTIAYVF